MRCVNETLPPRERVRWLLTTMRLSASSLAGPARPLVAVGTVSEAFMFLTTAAAAPRSGVCFGPSDGVAAGFVGAAFAGSAVCCLSARSAARPMTVASVRAAAGAGDGAGAALAAAPLALGPADGLVPFDGAGEAASRAGAWP